jgi:hypothetical protein
MRPGATRVSSTRQTRTDASHRVTLRHDSFIAPCHVLPGGVFSNLRAIIAHTFCAIVLRHGICLPVTPCSQLSFF